jgi:hypothetical protein
MSEPVTAKPRNEKGEKPEKDNEKQEKSRGEKNWDEKWRRDPLNAAVWALILIWLGLTLLAKNLDAFQSARVFGSLMPQEGWSRLFFAGAGGILLLQVLFRLLVPAYRAPVVGTIILAVVFLAIGLGNWIGNLGWGWILLPILVILVGLLILFRGLFRKRE